MSLSFKQRDLVNLEFALQREFLGTNREGGYLSTTLNFCNTSRYHGLLIVPIDNFLGRNHLLLSSLDETIVVNDKEFNFGIHEYPGTFFPKGHKYIIESELNKYYSITYQVAGVSLRKDIMMLHKQPQMLIRYTLLSGPETVRLRLKPFLAFRDIHQLCKENSVADTHYRRVPQGVAMKLYEGFPTLYMQLSEEQSYKHDPHWYKDLQYSKDRERGGDYQEDLLVPGEFELNLSLDKPLVFSASTTEEKASELVEEFQQAAQQRAPRDNFEHCLQYAANQFVIEKLNETRIKAGYPWHLSYGRNTFLSLPGIAIATGNTALFEQVIDSMIQYQKGGLFPRLISSHTAPEFNSDTSLWLFWTLQQYERWAKVPQAMLWKKYAHTLTQVLEAYREGRTFPQVAMQENKLIYNQRYHRPLTWMNGTIAGKPVLERSGYVVEVNALWYNAICYALDLAKAAKDEAFVAQWEGYPEQIAQSFLSVFWNDKVGYLADSEEGGQQDLSVRPNQLITCALDYSPLKESQKKQVLDLMKEKLLTERGLRTLAPDDKRYRGRCEGSMAEQEAAIYQGGTHTWLLGFYIESCLRLYGGDFVPKAEELLSKESEDIHHYGIGLISEFYDGNPPYSGHGCISQARNVAEIVRSVYLINHYKEENSPKR
ncbi:putative glycogen debranching enzyme, type [Capnocytophaga sp. oral taxon 863 str. F0517]|uniref:amylo-alpha-1,6-glucosidase n=1 Tax=Capnocytophaga sp. oral taxon 863 TaxID=1227265 RepID=UPI00039623D3|nr:amylo-alpha-1,6-glucosidase [Capnocytophaga sp. oral taxon 863]ERI62796.1 putative glycogen debranching enzyme, type [Capnocytophaga sp. oral taxon 863 str. F0517]